jgi:carboxymethylenebutenolidase
LGFRGYGETGGVLTLGAPDVFQGRAAATPAEARRLVDACQPAHALSGVEAAVSWLRDRDAAASPGQGAAATPGGGIALLGFSFGAGLALSCVACGLGNAVVVFYGTAPPERLAGLRVPVLGHFAETDEFEPSVVVTALFDWLRRKGVPPTARTYPGTGHWFAEPSRPAYDAAATVQAWEATLAFLRDNLVG